MATHKSAIKRIRQSQVRRLKNRYQHKTARTLVKKLNSTNDKAEAEKLFINVSSTLDKLVKKKIIHKNKAANNKSKLAKFVNSL
ncbi:MAG: 30S ribosomal protein S20 [Cytophagales bacterium]|nr:30S ribosomal protein S20 [Cytophagales bacterium]